MDMNSNEPASTQKGVAKSLETNIELLYIKRGFIAWERRKKQKTKKHN